MTIASYYIYNAIIVNEGRRFPGAVYIQNEEIAEVFEGRAPSGYLFSEGTVRIDAGEKFLIPGIIDEHTHFRDPGLTDKADMATESRAAIAGGVTSFMEMPNTIPNATTLDLLEEKFRIAAGKSLANYSFYLGATNDNLAEITKANPEKICGLKLFLGASTGNMLVDDPIALDAIFAASPLLIAVHAEEESVIRRNMAQFKAQYGDHIPPAAHPLIRSEEACFISSEKAVAMARKYNARLHLLHLSTAKELELLQNDVPLSEKRITGEVCVHHLWFDDRDYLDHGCFIKWNPAIKTSADREALLVALLNGKLDVVATDHAPHLKEEKERGDLSCPSGGPLIQHSLVAMMGLSHLGKITLEKIVEKMCHAPATLFHIPDRGFLRKGYKADLVLVDDDNPWVVEKENILYKCGWSPFEGVTFKSRVTHTWVNGQLVFQNGQFDVTRKGQRLHFSY